MKKLTLLSTAIAALLLNGIAAAAPAGRISTNDVLVSYAFLSFVETFDTRDITVTLRDEYAEGDFVILLFPGENIVDTSALDPSASSTAGSGLKGVTLDYVTAGYDAENEETWVKYRVTELTGSGSDTTVGVSLNLGNVTINAPELEGLDSLSVETISRTSYDNYPDAEGDTPDPLDVSDENSVSLVSIAIQYQYYSQMLTNSTWGFDRTVDVINDYRVAFTSGTSDTVIWDIDENRDVSWFDGWAAPYERRVTYSGANMFSWIIDESPNDPSSFDFSSQASATGSGCKVELVSESELVSVCETTALGHFRSDLTLTPNGTALIPSGTFKAQGRIFTNGVSSSTTVPYTLRSGEQPDYIVELAELDYGEWDINGSETRIPYMPYSAQASAEAGSTGIDQILYVTNKSQKDYDDFVPPIYIDVITESGEREHFSSDDLGGLTAGKGITKLAGALREAMFARGLLDNSQKVSIMVTVPENPANIEVYSAYNVGGSDRGWVQNDSQRVFEETPLRD
ncbi:hypothetical protein ACFOD1_02615 [Pseudidiomarina halophila]|uniref:Uncharacterized protein n=2 Tax=Pseudomonadota TaxID=1224 RepID=A0A432XX56_9GAMM|nr:hypothetical protein [Pseudidiomarina halophila]RUO53161.1 hypothetical protein CWI69_09070 [Pseudidiomarina halophila]